VLGLGVADLAMATQALVDARVPVVRRTDSAVVIHPAATGEVPLVLVEQLLPGDPRQRVL
jgi:hypothetical protein